MNFGGNKFLLRPIISKRQGRSALGYLFHSFIKIYLVKILFSFVVDYDVYSCF